MSFSDEDTVMKSGRMQTGKDGWRKMVGVVDIPLFPFFSDSFFLKQRYAYRLWLISPIHPIYLLTYLPGSLPAWVREVRLLAFFLNPRVLFITKME